MLHIITTTIMNSRLTTAPTVTVWSNRLRLGLMLVLFDFMLVKTVFDFMLVETVLFGRVLVETVLFDTVGSAGALGVTARVVFSVVSFADTDLETRDGDLRAPVTFACDTFFDTISRRLSALVLTDVLDMFMEDALCPCLRALFSVPNERCINILCQASMCQSRNIMINAHHITCTNTFSTLCKRYR